jgi:phospholipid/cholesterol/gamma-HCH transport system substrate-binding protein
LKISKEFKIGFIFIIAIGILIWGFNFLKGKNVFSKERVFYAVYQQVGGLEPSKPVLISGLKVGQVKKLYFAPSMNGDIIVVLTISQDFPIPKNTVALIYSQDLMGSKAVSLELGNSQELAQSGDTLLTSVEASLKEEVNQQILPLKLKAEDLISSIDTMVVAVKGVFNKDIRNELISSIRSIRLTFENLENTTENLDTLVSTQSERIASILNHLDQITKNLSENKDEISAILTNVADLSDTLAHSNLPVILDNLEKATTDLSTALEKVQNGEGTLGKLVNDDKLYNELDKAATELNRLLEDVRLHPKKYVRFSVF